MSDQSANLLNIIHHYYPVGIPTSDPAYHATQEHRCLVEARKNAASDSKAWHTLLDRLEARFPDRVIQDRSAHLAMGTMDAAYSGWLWLPARHPSERNHRIGFLVSFIAPYYVVYAASTMVAPAPERPDTKGDVERGTGDDGPHLIVHKSPPRPPSLAPRQQIRHTFAEDEDAYARAVAEEIEAAFGESYQPLPVTLGNQTVADVAAGNRQSGQATLFDCLFSDAW